MFRNVKTKVCILRLVAFNLMFVLSLTTASAFAQGSDAPEKTARAFYSALKNRNRRTALKYASPKVVRKLFKNHNKNISWQFANCEEPKIKEYGDIVCFYNFSGGGVGMFLRKKAKEQYFIVSTYYLTED